jgi:hypothetical protein
MNWCRRWSHPTLLRPKNMLCSSRQGYNVSVSVE